MPPERQFSDPPDVSDPNIEWFQPWIENYMLEFKPQQEGPKVLLFSRLQRSDDPKSYPLDRCPSRCVNERVEGQVEGCVKAKGSSVPVLPLGPLPQQVCARGWGGAG